MKITYIHKNKYVLISLYEKGRSMHMCFLPPSSSIVVSQRQAFSGVLSTLRPVSLRLYARGLRGSSAFQVTCGLDELLDLIVDINIIIILIIMN